MTAADRLTDALALIYARHGIDASDYLMLLDVVRDVRSETPPGDVVKPTGNVVFMPGWPQWGLA